MRRGNPLIYSAAETISASGRGRCRAAGRVAHRVGASLSDRGRCASIVGFAAGGAHRHRRAPDGSMAVGAARSAIRRREPAGCRQQYRHRGGRACAAGRLHAPPGRSRRTRSTRRSTTSSISISSATSRRSRASSACPIVMVVNPSVPAKTVPEFIAYAKANPGKINMASAGIGTAPHVSGELFKMMTGVDMVHVPYRGGAPALTDLTRRTGAGHVRLHCRRRSSTSGPASCARWR